MIVAGSKTLVLKMKSRQIQTDSSDIQVAKPIELQLRGALSSERGTVEFQLL
jgi:hypothetical protein